jgi:hypothetical protein
MNANNNHPKGLLLLKQGTLIIAVALTALLSVQIIMAASTLHLPHFDVSLVDYSFDEGDKSTWVYTATVTKDLDLALSHVSLGYVDCVNITGDGASDTEPATDPHDGFDGAVIKWEDDELPPEIKNVGQTLTFTMTVIGATRNITTEDSTFISLKYGGGNGPDSREEGYLDGPICSTTAVDMINIEAKSNNSTQILLTGLLLAITLTASTKLRKLSGQGKE